MGNWRENMKRAIVVSVCSWVDISLRWNKGTGPRLRVLREKNGKKEGEGKCEWLSLPYDIV